MKKGAAGFSILFFLYRLAVAQTASDVLEKGIRVRSGEKIFLKYDKVLKYDVGISLNDVANPRDFITLPDSSIFLVSKTGVNIYLLPLNPLNFTTASEIKEITDQINEESSAAFGRISEIVKMAETTKEISVPGPKKPKGKPAPAIKQQVTIIDTCSGFNNIEIKLKSIDSFLKDSQKIKIVSLFEKLQKLTFEEEGITISQLTLIEKDMQSIENRFAKIDTLVNDTKKSIEAYNCDKTGGFIIKFIFNTIANELSNIFQAQRKRLTNLQKVFKIAKDFQLLASAGGGPGLKWSIPFSEVPSSTKKISIFTVTLKEGGFKLDENKEIVTGELKEVTKRIIKIRKFQLLVPEISTGIVYTFFKYNSYGTTTDGNGRQTVAPPVANEVKNINISTMVNFNLYSPNVDVHPLFQVGVGLNNGLPSVLAGVGARISSNPSNRLRITGGYALTWIKELDKLKVGDEVSGTAEIEKDLKFQRTMPLRPYIGIQYNF